MRTHLTAERLRELFHYDPETGVFTRIKRTSTSAPYLTGLPAGSKHSRGYIIIKIDQTGYKAHRLAWLYMTGEWPSAGVDHKDLRPDNNKWSNLRIADQQQNCANTKVRRNSSTGLKGVYPHQGTGKFAAKLCHKGKSFYLGLFSTPEAAHAAYRLKTETLNAEFART